MFNEDQDIFYGDRNSPLGLLFNARFKENTEADLSILDDAYKKCLDKFSIIFANNEISVYKILHYLHDKFHLQANQIKTINGLALESYFDPYANHKYNMIQMKELLNEGILHDITNKWVVLFNMKAEWSDKLAYYVYNEIREKGALGLIFNASGRKNFGEVLVRETYLNVTQFPEIKIDNKKTIKNDKY